MCEDGLVRGVATEVGLIPEMWCEGSVVPPLASKPTIAVSSQVVAKAKLEDSFECGIQEVIGWPLEVFGGDNDLHHECIGCVHMVI